jgi:antitoxin (DNA-binding transcriptional repressor) of toxin-antitoxin stability system
MDAPLHTEVTARELNQNSGRILDRVRNGETITVTRDGRPEAVIHQPGPLSPPVYPFRTDPMGPDPDLPVFDGPGLTEDEIHETLAEGFGL